MTTSMTEPDNIIVFQGEAGAHSHLACRDAFPEHTPIACPTFEDVFAEVAEARAGAGLIPIENTLAGRVVGIHRILHDSRLYVTGEHFQPVRHQLLGLPNADTSKLTSVMSHEMALGQCRKVIRALHVKPVVSADTAGAARLVAEAGDPTQAAIASALAGEIHNLKTLRANIEDAAGNITRFLAISRTPQDADPEGASLMTSFFFCVRNVPAALYKTLSGFATNGVNMTKLESCQIEGRFDATHFYADIEGHPAERPVRLALEELAFFSSEVRILGTYKQSPLRAEMRKAR